MIINVAIEIVDVRLRFRLSLLPPFLFFENGAHNISKPAHLFVPASAQVSFGCFDSSQALNRLHRSPDILLLLRDIRNQILQLVVRQIARRIEQVIDIVGDLQRRKN